MKTTHPLTTKNLTLCIDSMNRKIKSANKGKQVSGFLLFPKTHRVINDKRYKGFGRPKKSDYDSIDTLKIIKEFAKPLAFHE